MRYDPFREIDRFTEQLFGSSPTARAPFMPMDAQPRRIEVRTASPREAIEVG